VQTRTIPLAASLLLASSLAMQSVSPSQDWEKRFDQQTEKIVKANGTGTDLALQQQILRMVEEDQEIRKKHIAPNEQEFPELVKQMEQTDVRLTNELKQIVASHGWPTVALVGIRASQAAALILIHSPDRDWQEQLIPQLQKLVDLDQIIGSDIAPLIDKVLLSRGQLQRFGTRFKITGGKMVLEPVEDPKHLEERRARYLLPPMKIYRAMLRDMYKMPVQ
jgi:hypothetical protein